MSMSSQSSVLIQTRTSPIKFGHLTHLAIRNRSFRSAVSNPSNSGLLARRVHLRGGLDRGPVRDAHDAAGDGLAPSWETRLPMQTAAPNDSGCCHDTITLSEARSRLDQRRFSRPNTHFSAFFEIYRKIIFSQEDSAKFCKICKISQNFFFNLKIFRKCKTFFANFCRIFCRILQIL